MLRSRGSIAIELEILHESVFWIMTLLGSIALSIVGNLLTPITRRMLSRVSSAQKRKAEKRRERNEIIVNYLREDKSRIYILKLDVLHQLLWSILIQGFAISAVIAIDGLGGKVLAAALTIINFKFMADTMDLFSRVKMAESVDFEELNSKLSDYDKERNKANHSDR